MMLLMLLLLVVEITGNTIRQEIKAMAGGSVSLRCAVNQGSCGDFHSIKWYKENRRVFVYSPVVEFSKPEGDLLQRGSLQVDRREARLTISPVLTTDEGEYKCEITFLDISSNCPVVQLVKLTTLAPPEYVNLSLSTGAGTRPLLSNSVVGPFNQGSEITLVCSSGGGKPIPQVSWYMEGRLVPGSSSSSEDKDRTGTGQTEISLTVDRSQLGAKLECRSRNEALDDPLVASIQLDVSLRPESVKISGPESGLSAGSEVRLTCLAAGSRPAAVLTWFNGSNLYPHQPAGQVKLQSDGTYTTQSNLVFKASRFEDNQKMFCEAKNEVIEYYEEEPIRADTRLVVLYPPVVTTSPANITVNQTEQIFVSCNYKSNPATLTKVTWFLNGEVLRREEERYLGGPRRQPETRGGRYLGGTIGQPSLTILRATKLDIGDYTCQLENAEGAGMSRGSSRVDVYHPPTVQVTMQPDSPVKETEQRNVVLHCELIDGNPRRLTTVYWFINDTLINKLPNCKESGSLCDVDPSTLILEKVTRQSHGNFSCKGINEAGESQMSEQKPLEIYYPPGNATIIRNSDNIIKGGALTLTCYVAEPGRPPTNEFTWRRGGHELRGVTSSSWLIEPVTLETESDISCQAVNEVGAGGMDTQSLEVLAPPTFIESLKPYTGFTSESRNVNLSCQVECSPLCTISWLKDGVPIQTSSDLYTITSRQIPPNYSKNDFESVRSVLTWNLFNAAEGRLDRNTHNANYSCKSTGNSVGEGVSSHTHFRVEYAPDNLFISKEVVNVVEQTTPERIVCGAQAYPEASYMWKLRDQVIQTHNVLYFSNPVTRDQGGTYICEAHNRHGTALATTTLNVLYKPDCQIMQEKYDDEVVLVCSVDANPATVSVSWRHGNETIDELEELNALQSSIRIGLRPEDLGTYYCYVNNSVGTGVPCEIDIQGIGVLKNISSTKVIVIVAVITAALVAALIVGLAIFICRKKVPAEKVGNGSVVGKNNDISTNGTNGSQVVHKWPLRPGVHVHVNGLNTLTGSTSKLNHQISGFSYGAKTSRSSSSSGSDWASNASSNQELNTELEKKQNNRFNISGGGNKGGDPPASYPPSDLTSNGSRPGSRQKKSKRDLNKNQPDTLLPTFYENVSHQHKQRLDSIRRSESPADRLAGRMEGGMEGSTERLGRLDGRPRSQLSVLYGSTRSRRTASPCGGGIHSAPGSSIPCGGGIHSAPGSSIPCGGGIHSAPGSSIASMCTSGRHHGRYSTLHAPGHATAPHYAGYIKPMDLAEAEVESDPDQPATHPHERNLLIEYTTHVPYLYSHDTPILSSLTSQSFRGPQGGPPHPTGPRGGPPHPTEQMYQLSEPISPPKQFDSSPQPGKAGREAAY